MALLEIHNLTKKFGGVVAVNNLSLNVEKEAIFGLIGPNGAGKTTLTDLICGFQIPNYGEIYFKNELITGLKAHEIAQRGICKTFQIIRVFRGMTTIENMLAPAIWFSEKLDSLYKKAIKLLEFFDLADLKDELAGNLSGGQQKLLELARVSMLDPEVFLFDEPFHGIHPAFRNKILNYIKTTNKKNGKTFVIISHDVPSIMRICHEVAVMNAGEVIAKGPPLQIQKSKRVIETYLGV